MLLKVFEWIVSRAQMLGSDVVKGFPSWARPASSPPVISVQLLSWEPIPSQPRIGQPIPRSTTTFRVTVFARNEVELCSLVESAGALWRSEPTAVIDGTRVLVVVTAGTRHDSVSPVQQEQYAFWFTIRVSW